MKQIIDFEQFQPPVLTSRSLQAELEHRKLRRQVTLITIAGLLFNLCILISMVLLLPINITLAAICGGYAIVSMTGSGVISILFVQKRREIILC